PVFVLAPGRGSPSFTCSSKHCDVILRYGDGAPGPVTPAPASPRSKPRVLEGTHAEMGSAARVMSWHFAQTESETRGTVVPFGIAPISTPLGLGKGWSVTSLPAPHRITLSL